MASPRTLPGGCRAAKFCTNERAGYLYDGGIEECIGRFDGWLRRAFIHTECEYHKPREDIDSRLPATVWKDRAVHGSSIFLRFQTMRPGCCCDYTVMSRHVGNALEDLVVALADGAAAIYLGRGPQMGSGDSEWPTLVRPSIKSTRALERFRNEIALQSWFQRNYNSVVAMFEDRFELWTMEVLSNSEGSSLVGSQQQTREDDFAEDLKLKRIELPARRGKELRALTGWRYFYSLYLEFSDIVGPLLQVLVRKLGEAVSFLLVRLIGRSLGLVFEGIRQSVRWSSK